MAFKLGMAVDACIAYNAHARFHYLRIDARSQWVGRGKNNISGTKQAINIKLSTKVDPFLFCFTWPWLWKPSYGLTVLFFMHLHGDSSVKFTRSIATYRRMKVNWLSQSKHYCQDLIYIATFIYCDEARLLGAGSKKVNFVPNTSGIHEKRRLAPIYHNEVLLLLLFRIMNN